jgi:DNA-binding response OmpR family regulator
MPERTPAGRARGTRQRAAEIGVAEYLSKPFELDALIAIVKRHLGSAA